ncbi:hypothetical protein CI15_06430 [Paraburkholderia monticola]|uniref:Uncharacterized protein n=1 Tax=Paraburkholderia monticola TaxID=1399968 RepID=A0A149PXT4_9BURK|nr:hypothetical protein CI15_06430 [Paraburkholderia monticola]
MRIFLSLRIEKLIRDTNFFKRHARVSTLVERFASDDFLDSVPPQFRPVNTAGLGLDKLLCEPNAY